MRPFPSIADHALITGTTRMDTDAMDGSIVPTPPPASNDNLALIRLRRADGTILPATPIVIHFR
jgi:hypothetical protein